jgi:peptidyl-prolyl cis-trans isomerase B (cyclophilin B)
MGRRQQFAITVVFLAALCLTGAVSAAASTPARTSSPAAADARGLAPFPGRAAGAAPAAVTAADPCGYLPAIPADRFKGIPVFDAAKAAQPYHATLFTTQGRITFQALTDKAPCTTYSFRFLAERSFYNLTHCHRLVTQRIFVLQCGDPTGTGSGGPGYSFNDENLAGATYPAGTVAMANAGPNTNGSQFFICTKDTVLRPNYTPFGRVTAGLEVLRKIDAAGEDDQNGPGDGYPNLYVGILTVGISGR